MTLIACPHCGIVVDLNVLEKNETDRYAVRIYKNPDGRVIWQCHHCNARNEVIKNECGAYVIPFKHENNTITVDTIMESSR